MQFSRRAIYNSDSRPIVNEILAHIDNPHTLEDKTELFGRFLSIIVDEVDKKLDDFKLIIPHQFYEFMSAMDEKITERLSVKVDVTSTDKQSLDLMQQICDDGFSMAANLQDAEAIYLLPSNTEYVFIDLKYIPCLKDDIPFLTASYKCVASPISDHKQVASLYKAGFHHFCGNFVEKPKEISSTAISPNKTAILNLLATLSDPDVELHKVNKLLVADPVLSYKILKIVNSPIYRGTTEIQSVQDAVVRFGLQNLKKWVYMLSLCLLNDQNPTLLKLALQRGIMCQHLAIHRKVASPDPYYSAGLLSLLDVLLEKPIEKLLKKTQISNEIKLAILEHKGPIGEVLQIVKSYQNGNLDNTDPTLTQVFLESAQETNQLMRSLGLNNE